MPEVNLVWCVWKKEANLNSCERFLRKIRPENKLNGFLNPKKLFWIKYFFFTVVATRLILKYHPLFVRDPKLSKRVKTEPIWTFLIVVFSSVSTHTRLLFIQTKKNRK